MSKSVARKAGQQVGRALRSVKRALPPKVTPKMTKKQVAAQMARELHEEWIADNGSGGDIISDMSYRAHAMAVVRLLGLDENLVIEATQVRRQVGLEILDVFKLGFDGTLKQRVEKSRDEVAEISIQNKADAEKAALKRRQRNKLG